MKQAFLILAIVLQGALRVDATENNSCGAQSVTVEKGSSFAVDVYLNNSDTLAGMQIPIYFRSDNVDMRCDSVSFSQGRCHDFVISDYKIEPIERIVYFVLINTYGKPLLPGKGNVATIWFTVSPLSQSGKVELFSGPKAFLPEQNIEYNFLFWQPSAKQVSCRYQPGYITVK